VTGGETTPRVPRWPLLLIALPAFVAIWSGWVGLGRLTGFGPVVLLPGIADQWVIDSAITLPIGVESYAAYAMFVWLAPDSVRVSAEARRFACWSSIGSLVLGMAGQVAYHLMTAAGMKVAPWQITAFVACLPVVVVGAAAALVHLTHRTGDGDVGEIDEPDVEERPVPDVEKVDDRGLSLIWDSAPPATPKPAAAPARARVIAQLDEQGRPDYLDKSLPLERRIDLAVAAEFAAGAKTPPGQRRIAGLLGESRAKVRTVFDKRAAASRNGHLVETS
jgi:hypothetical protein